MATKTKPRTEQAERGGRSLKHQPNRFVGLFLAPFAGLVTAWLIHVWTLGVNLHAGPYAWVVHASAAAPFVAEWLIAAVTAWLSFQAWRFTEHRERAKREALVVSVLVLGTMFGISVGTGPHYWWSPLFIIAGWVVAITWSLARLDVARNDKAADEAKEDTFLEKIGLKGWRARKAVPNLDDKGEHVSTTVEMQHAEGGTVEELQSRVPNIESGTAAPAGLSRVVGTDRADRSTLTVMHVDPLKDIVRLAEPAAPGGSISDPAGLITGIYSTGAPVRAYIGGGRHITPSSYMFMGQTRTGKTTTENALLVEIQTRRDAVILYLNKAKGMQDVRPIIPGIEACVLANEADQGAIYREAMKTIRRIMTYRQGQLAVFGIDAWSAECYSSPPWRTDGDGRRVQMEPMPMLICHVGEADSILEEDRNGESVYLASKGLSLGVVTGWSLQRADYQRMPTGLRYNIGTSWCFGVGDNDSAEFALTKAVIMAGAHPEQWGQRKPGYHYFTGLGVDDEMFPVHARSAGEGPNGEKITEALLRRSLEWAPRMTKLDQGSVLATNYENDGKKGNWWRETVAETDRIRAELLGRKPATVTPQVSATVTPQVSTPADDDDRKEMDELEQELRETTHVDGVELYPQIDGVRATRADATAPTPRAAEGDEFSWEDDKPAPRDRSAALAALRQALIELGADESLRDRDGVTIVDVPLILDRYPFRERPWFVEALKDMSEGRLDGPAGWVLSTARDLGYGRGKYRLQHVPGGNG